MLDGEAKVHLKKRKEKSWNEEKEEEPANKVIVLEENEVKTTKKIHTPNGREEVKKEWPEDAANAAEATEYILHGFIVHSGDNPSYGHYTCDIFYPPNSWRYFSDERNYSIPKERAKKDATNGYLFFYVHKSLFDISSKFPNEK